MKNRATLILLAALLTGCGSVDQKQKQPVAFESVPEPARIFVKWNGANFGREYLGVTPCTNLVTGLKKDRTPCDASGLLFGVGGFTMTFEAEPLTNAPGLYPQHLDFRQDGALWNGERVPEKIFFDLSKPAPAPKK